MIVRDPFRALAAGQAVAPPSPVPGARRRRLSCALLIASACALAGCGLENGPGSIMVDPGRYSVYKCNDLATQLKTLGAKEKELRALMDKASDGGGGTVIGALAYRPDYESVLTQERLVQHEAVEKKCEIAPNFQSDQTIR